MKVEDVRFAPGSKVMYAGAVCEVVRVDEVEAPLSKSTVAIVTIRRPRAGEKRVFPSEIYPAFELAPAKVPVADPETFR